MSTRLNRIVKEQLSSKPDVLCEPVMTIGEAAEKTNLSESALRKYENEGLIIYHRSSGNVRVLSEEDINRIDCIKKLIKEKGLNLEGIRRLWALFPCWECNECKPEEIECCSAIQDSNRPCWMTKAKESGKTRELCRMCDVYRAVADCSEEMKFIVHEKLSAHFVE